MTFRGRDTLHGLQLFTLNLLIMEKFNEILGIPVEFDEKITDSTEWFALYVSQKGDEKFLGFIAGFDKFKNGKWGSTMMRDESGEELEFDSMKEVVEALFFWFKISPVGHYRKIVEGVVSMYIADDTMEHWDDDD